MTPQCVTPANVGNRKYQDFAPQKASSGHLLTKADRFLGLGCEALLDLRHLGPWIGAFR